MSPVALRSAAGAPRCELVVEQQPPRPHQLGVDVRPGPRSSRAHRTRHLHTGHARTQQPRHVLGPDPTGGDQPSSDGRVAREVEKLLVSTLGVDRRPRRQDGVHAGEAKHVPPGPPVLERAIQRPGEGPRAVQLLTQRGGQLHVDLQLIGGEPCDHSVGTSSHVLARQPDHTVEPSASRGVRTVGIGGQPQQRPYW